MQIYESRKVHMILQTIKSGLLLTVPVLLSSAFAYGQATAVPVVSPDSVAAGEARPHSWVVVPADGTSNLNLVHAPGQTTCGSANPCYYFESDIWTAYGLRPLQSRGNYGQGITIAIVDAYYDPQIAQNLQNFSTYSYLPLGTAGTTISCSTAPTFKVVSQTGGSPAAVTFNAGWAEEANLDVQQAHAMAPCANILLVATTNNSFANLSTGVQYAYAHADLVSNSYGGNEFSGEASSDPIYAGSPVPLIFSSGDVGAVTEYPCVSPYVTCVGGTHLLTTPTSFRTNESAWFGSAGGSSGGCSTGGELLPLYEVGFSNSNCGAARGVPDVSALADPFTGVNIALGSNIEPAASVYCCIGGTSLAAPLTAGILANVDAARVIAGKPKLSGALNSLIYQAAGYSPSGSSTLPAPYGSAYRNYFFDVFNGNTGYPATMYWDRTTGLGVPSFASLGNYLITNVP